MAVRKHLTVAGRIYPALSAFFIGPDDVRRVLEALARNDVEVADFFVLVFFGWATVPLSKLAYDQWARFSVKPRKEWRETYSYLAVDHFAQAARIAILVCLADCLDVALAAMGFSLFEADRDHPIDFGWITARVAYTVWIAQRAAVLKRYVISLLVQTKPEKLGKAKIYDRFLNGVIFFITAMFVIDMIDADVGAGLTSLFAMGGMGTLVFTLASKDLATQLVSGMALTASDKFYEGDFVRLGDGTQGTVIHLSWLHTILRAGDESHVKIPNSQIANMRVCNLSRIETSQVRQTLYFKHSDADKMPTVIASIKDKIIGACPELITDGSRPFRANWTEITSDRLEVVVDCRFRLKPLGDKYWDNRQKVLEAIKEALKETHVECAIPSVLHKTE